jgi:large subunit ribosomal protein L23
MKQIIIKPIVTEKSDKLASKSNQYTFEVAKTANKIVIGKAIEAYYNVTVVGVNTTIMPSKAKSRMTKKAVVKGRVSSYKKAIVTLAEGDTIEVFGGASEEEAGE